MYLPERGNRRAALAPWQRASARIMRKMKDEDIRAIV
tara:strand:- start:781 stop:891 length:111 start_codon:yes stop_codon:yes gene_type:complete